MIRKGAVARSRNRATTVQVVRPSRRAVAPVQVARFRNGAAAPVGRVELVGGDTEAALVEGDYRSAVHAGYARKCHPRGHFRVVRCLPGFPLGEAQYYDAERGARNALRSTHRFGRGRSHLWRNHREVSWGIW